MKLALWLVVLFAALVPAGDAQIANIAPDGFPEVAEQYFLSAQTVTDSQTTVHKTLTTEPDAEASYTTFLVPGTDLIGALPAPLGVASDHWERPESRAKDTLLTTDSSARLYFIANAQALSVFEVRLFDVGPGGLATRITSNTQQFVTALSLQAIDFPLQTAGTVILQGHHLRMEVFAETSNAAVVLQYGGEAPSALVGLHTKWLDTDGDGMANSDERAVGRNPFNPNDTPADARDRDGDGLSDATERALGTDPNKADTDGDGYGDGIEVYAGSNPRDPQSKPYDRNQNGLPDAFEQNYFQNTTIINSSTPCTPGPGCIDPHGDPDGDGCDNLCEAAHATNPNNPDTDGDGVPDGQEIKDGTNPLSPGNPAQNLLQSIPEPVVGAGLFAAGTTIAIAGLLRRN